MNYAWPKMQTGWNHEFIYPDRQIDANLLAYSPGFAGIHCMFTPATTFASVSFDLLIAISFVASLLSWRVPLLQAAKTTNRLVFARMPRGQIILLVIVLALIALVIAILWPSEAH